METGKEPKNRMALAEQLFMETLADTYHIHKLNISQCDPLVLKFREKINGESVKWLWENKELK